MPRKNEYDLAAAFQKIEDELIASMIRNMDRHRAEETKEGYNWSMWQTEQLKALEKYKVRNQKKYSKQFKSINDQIDSLIRMSRSKGGMQQERRILQAIKKGFKGAKKTGSGATAEFFKLNDRKLEALIKATRDDMEKVETAVLRKANDDYRKAIFNAQVYANTGAGTYEKAVDMATKDMLSRGLNCVEYANGARHTLSDYADMAIRTASKRAYLQGEGEKRQEWGVTTVIMAKRGNPCPKCLPFVGKVLIDDVWSGGSKDGVDPETGKKYPLMSYAISKGLYHPRCKDSHTTYFPGISTADDIWTKEDLEEIGLQNQQEARQQYAERQVEKYGRLAEYSLDKENQKEYQIKAEEWKDQAYRPVTRGEASTIFIKQQQKINIKRVESYSEIYISNQTNIKPRALHTLNQRTEQALKEWEVSLERRPKIIIVSPDEMPTAYGKYDAIQNVVFYIPQIADSKVIKDQGNVEFHEMWHMKQAENFRKRYGEITRENYGKYIENSCKEAKKTIDRAGITEYNVSDISSYADQMFWIDRYDEVEAEYMVKHRRGKKHGNSQVSGGDSKGDGNL